MLQQAPWRRSSRWLGPACHRRQRTEYQICHVSCPMLRPVVPLSFSVPPRRTRQDLVSPSYRANPCQPLCAYRYRQQERSCPYRAWLRTKRIRQRLKRPERFLLWLLSCQRVPRQRPPPLVPRVTYPQQRPQRRPVSALPNTSHVAVPGYDYATGAAGYHGTSGQKRKFGAVEHHAHSRIIGPCQCPLAQPLRQPRVSPAPGLFLWVSKQRKRDIRSCYAGSRPPIDQARPARSQPVPHTEGGAVLWLAVR